MKNVMKKLAFVLALAMTFTLVAPAASASAATAPSFKKNGKILYINGDQSGTMTDSYRFYFNNAAGYTAKWVSLNTNVATVNATTGKITAKAPGTAVIEATLTNKKGNVVVLTNKVWVKQNAEEVGFGSMKAIENGVSVGDTFKINVYRQVGTKKVWLQTDVKTVTDTIVWESSNPAVATVNKWGTVTVLKAGEVTITASAVQKEGAYVSAKNSYTFTVASGITSVKQLSATKVELNFGSPVTAEQVSKETITLTNANGVNQTAFVKSVTLNDAKNVATVEVYTPFADKAVYTFEFKALSTKIDMTASVGKVTNVVITGPSKVEDNVAAQLTIKGYDANGVEVDVDINNASFELVDATANAWINNSDKKITVFSKNINVAVKGEYVTNEIDANYNVVKLPIEAVMISCVDSLDATDVAISDAVVTTKTEPSLTEDFKGNMTLPLVSNDTDTTFYLKVKVLNSAKEEVLATNAKYESTDSTKLIIDPATGALLPLKEGKVGLIVTVGELKNIFEVTIGGKEVIGTITPNKTSVSLSNGTVDNTAKFEIGVKSNYGGEYTADNEDVKVEYVSTNVASEKRASYSGLQVSAGKVTFTVNARGAQKGQHAFRVTIEDRILIVTVTVADIADATNGVENLAFKADLNTVDTCIKAGSSLENYEFEVKAFGYGNGVALNSVTTGLAVTIKNSEGKIIYAQDTNGVKSVTSSAINVEDGVITVSAVTGSGLTSTEDYTKLATGTYQISGYVYYDLDSKEYTTTAPSGENNVVQKAIAPISFTVTDSQKAVTVEWSDTKAETSTKTEAGIKAAIETLLSAKDSEGVSTTVSVDDIEISTTYTDGATGTFYVALRKVELTENVNASGKKVAHTLTPGQVFVVTVK